MISMRAIRSNHWEKKKNYLNNGPMETFEIYTEYVILYYVHDNCFFFFITALKFSFFFYLNLLPLAYS